MARAEAEQLAAAVAESSPQAWVEWVRQTGGDRSAEDFTAAATRGRRWRSTPTPELGALVLAGEHGAKAYAAALAEVATAAATLGEPTPQAVGAAGTAAAAQLSALTTGSAPAGPTRPPLGIQAGANAARSAEQPEVLTDAVRGLWGQVMGQLGDVQRRLARTAAETGRSGSTLDLGLNADPFGRGAFGGLGDAEVPPRAQEPGDGAAAAHEGAAGEPAPTQAAPNPTTPGAQATPAKPEPEPKTLEELLAELDDLVGLEAVKAEIHRQVALLKIEAKRAEAGLKTPTITRHLVFVGNPGTGSSVGSIEPSGCCPRGSSSRLTAPNSSPVISVRRRSRPPRWWRPRRAGCCSSTRPIR